MMPRDQLVNSPYFCFICRLLYMVDVAQLVRALDCGSRGRGFEPRLPPHLLPSLLGAPHQFLPPFVAPVREFIVRFWSYVYILLCTMAKARPTIVPQPRLVACRVLLMHRVAGRHMLGRGPVHPPIERRAGSRGGVTSSLLV